MTNTLAAGSYVDHFSVLRCIGSGGMADVWLARDTRLGRTVALKVIRAAWFFVRWPMRSS